MHHSDESWQKPATPDLDSRQVKAIGSKMPAAAIAYAGFMAKAAKQRLMDPSRMTAQRPVFIHSPKFAKNVYPEECPFNSGRAEMTKRILHSMGMLSGRDGIEFEAQSADRTVLQGFHTAEYLDILRDSAQGTFSEESLGAGLGTPDTPIFEAMYDHSVLVAGATLLGAELIRDGQTRIAFNPSGGLHHAHRSRAAGFCYINDVVIGCQCLANAGMKVLFLDVDAHHSDGVQGAFWNNRSVMTISFHESPYTLYPGTGFETEIGGPAAAGFSVNVPLPAGTTDASYLGAVREIVPPLAHAFNPDAIVLELGMDGLNGDPLTHLSLTNNAYAEVVEMILSFRKPVLATGGGGYNILNTARSWALMWSILSGSGTDEEMALGLGGVMLESTEWKAGLRDRALAIPPNDLEEAGRTLERTITEVKRLVFPLHGL